MKLWSGLELPETLKELVDPSHTALLMWDFARGPVSQAFNARELTECSGRLLGAARRAGLPIFYSRQTDLAWEDTGAPIVRLRMKQFKIEDLSRFERHNVKGSAEWRIVEGLEPIEGEQVFEKFLPDAFLGTSFEWRLRRRGVRTIVLAGVSVETGIENTARDAVNRGFFAVVVRDCVGGRSAEAYHRSVEALAAMYDVYGSAEVVRAWEG